MNNQQFDELFSEVNDKVDEDDIQKPDPNSIEAIDRQRLWQRGILFWFSIIGSLVGLVVFYILLFTKELGVIEFATLTISVFIQFISVISIIANNLWDDREHKLEATKKLNGN